MQITLKLVQNKDYLLLPANTVSVLRQQNLLVLDAKIVANKEAVPVGRIDNLKLYFKSV
jgi:hypothetical protein